MAQKWRSVGSSSGSSLEDPPTQPPPAPSSSGIMEGSDLERMPSTLRRIHMSSTAEPDINEKKPWGMLLSLNPKLFEDIMLVEPEYLVGRDPACSIRPDFRTISSRHCRIFTETDPKGDVVCRLQDTSKNGTFVNGRRVGRLEFITLHHNTEIQFAVPSSSHDDKHYLFQLVPAPVSASTPATVGRAIRDHYEILKELGSGTFAHVFLAVDKETGRHVAIKQIDKRKCSTNSKFMLNLERETRIMMQLDHPNLVRIIDFYDEPDTLYLVLELLHGGELFDRIIERGKFDDGEARHLAVQLLEGVKYLHSNGIAHRDLKPENILLVDKTGLDIKISDFGFARIVGENSFMSTVCGTPYYLAPDVLSKRTAGYGKAVDIWSLGVILYILLCGFPPFSDDRKHLPLVEQIRKGDYNFPSPWWDAVDPAAIDLVKRMLQVDPAARITVEGALSHPWVARGGARVPATVATQTTGRRPLTREETALNPVHIARPQVAQPISAPRRPPPPAAAAAAAAPAAKRKADQMEAVQPRRPVRAASEAAREKTAAHFESKRSRR